MEREAVKKTERRPLPLSENARKAKNAQQKKYREAHKEQIAEYAKKYRAEHLEELRAYNRDYQRRNREQLRQKRIEYWERKGQEQMKTADEVSNLIEESETDSSIWYKDAYRTEIVASADAIITYKTENPIPSARPAPGTEQQ